MTAGPNRLAIAIAVSVAGLLFVSASPSALAASRVCRQLEAELAGAGSAPSGKYAKAIQRQRDQLAKARSRASDARCGGFSLFSGGSCRALNATVRRMESNLAALERKQAEGSSGKSRARILASLDANNCRDQDIAQAPISPRAGSSGSYLFDRLFGRGGNRNRQEEAPAPAVRQRPDDGQQGFGGRFQTVCVRTCDGYHFPMSYSSSRRDLTRDQQNCEAACPGTEMQVFLRSSSDQEEDGDEASNMVSAANGTLYSALPAAYLYKREGAERPSACGCNPPKNYSIIAGNHPPSHEETSSTGEPPPQGIASAQQSTSSFVTPQSLPPHATEAAASADEPEQPAPEALERPLPDNRKVRVVGPEFLPDPSAAIDLRAPVPKPGP